MIANKFKAVLADAEQRHMAISSLVALTVRVAEWPFCLPC
jgi:hypothetical protein